MLEDVREDDDVEPARRKPREHVPVEELETVVHIVVAGEGEVTGIVVDADDARVRPDDEVVGELALPGSDVQHTLTGPHTLDEEVVVARESVLGMNASVVRDRREIELPVHVVVGDEQFAYCAPPIGVGPEGGEPQPRHRAKEPQRHHEPEGTPWHAVTGCARRSAKLSNDAHDVGRSTNVARRSSHMGSRLCSA
jgi:hypothetical protein